MELITDSLYGYRQPVYCLDDKRNKPFTESLLYSLISSINIKFLFYFIFLPIFLNSSRSCSHEVFFNIDPQTSCLCQRRMIYEWSFNKHFIKFWVLLDNQLKLIKTLFIQSTPYRRLTAVQQTMIGGKWIMIGHHSIPPIILIRPISFGLSELPSRDSRVWLYSSWSFLHCKLHSSGSYCSNLLLCQGRSRNVHSFKRCEKTGSFVWLFIRHLNTLSQ